MNVTILRFPGTNCEYDMEYAYTLAGAKTVITWHGETALPHKTDLVIVPGGFSYGDYLRSGAIARFAPIMQSVGEYAKKGGKVLGICNGFQILLESHLLPGAMKKNESMHFISKKETLRVEQNNNDFLKFFNIGDEITLPIAHAEGNYYIDPEGLKSLYDNDQVILTYVNNPNGSIDSIAGICNKEKNIFGLMPHPERAVDKHLGEDAGLKMLEGLIKG